MKSTSENPLVCDWCSSHADTLQHYTLNHTLTDPIRVCDRCASVLWAAEVLWTNGIADENEMVTTLALAAQHAGDVPTTPKAFAARYKRLEFVRTVDGVPVARLKPFVAEIVAYPGRTLPKLVRLEILSKFAEPSAVAERYGELVAQSGLPVFDDRPGRVTWEYPDARLLVGVGPCQEIEAWRLDHFAAYPQVHRFSFPMAYVVERIIEGLLGAPKRSGTPGDEVLAGGLGDHGRDKRNKPDTLIPAFVAWRAGERPGAPHPRDERRRIARVLNAALMEPLGKKPNEAKSSDSWDVVWRDARKVHPRFFRACLFVQDDERDFFQQQAP